MDDGKRETSVDNPNILNTATSSLAVLAEVAQSHSSQISLPDLIGEQNGAADCPCEEDEEMPPLEGDEIKRKTDQQGYIISVTHHATNYVVSM